MLATLILEAEDLSMALEELLAMDVTVMLAEVKEACDKKIVIILE